MALPEAAFTKEHAEILIWVLAGIVAVLGKVTYDATAGWKKRLEDKIDKVFEQYHHCQTELPMKYLSKEEFSKEFNNFLLIRSKEWAEFRADYKEFNAAFWRHTHNGAGKPDVA